MPTTCGTVSIGSWPDCSIGEDTAVEVQFGLTFDAVPSLVVQLAALDAASPCGKRVDVWASDAAREGFRLHVRTWEDSTTYGVKVSWVASSEPAVVRLGALSLGPGAEHGPSKTEARPVSFEEPLPVAPRVALGLAAIDVQGDDHLRVQSECLDIRRDSFTVRAGSWESSVVRSARTSWIASASPAVLQCGTVQLGAWPDDEIKDGSDRYVDVEFETAFDSGPSVALALTCIDASGAAPVRVDTWSDNVRSDGFRLHVRSWEDSVTWRVAVSWVATPVVPNPTAWSVPPHQPPKEYIVEGPPLGVGWWGVTHRARHAVNGNVYAVKTCRHPFKQHEQVLSRELKTLTSLPVHDNLLRYYECTLQADRLHIVTEYLDAFTLSELVPGPDGPCQQRHTADVVLRWALQMCDGLAHLHGAGIVHRDLHGDNVLVERGFDGAPSAGPRAVRIIDFGAAGLYGDAACPKLMSKDAGCWLYFSPERRAGRAFDGRDDVWAVGCHVTELSTGRLIRKRRDCGEDGGGFALEPETVGRAVEDCRACDGTGRCGRTAALLLEFRAERRPSAAAARETLCRLLLGASTGKRGSPGSGSCSRRCRRRRCEA